MREAEFFGVYAAYFLLHTPYLLAGKKKIYERSQGTLRWPDHRE
jgi:hypothetical protein